MILLSFSADDLDQLEELRANAKCPMVRRKAQVLYMKSQRMKHKLIREECNVANGTLCNYFNGFKTGGIEYVRTPSKLTNYYKREISDATDNL